MIKKKKILALGPISPQPEDILSLASTLFFLNKEYEISYLDSVAIRQNISNKEYYAQWKEKLTPAINEYDVFLGFSFGGVILQQCFPLFTNTNKSIVLFSTPAFADKALKQKLGNVISLCKEQKLTEALTALYQSVFYPRKMPPLFATTDPTDKKDPLPLFFDSMNKTLAFERLIFGLTRILDTDSRQILKESNVEYLHLIGEYSHLVNTDNVIAAKNGDLIIVPKSSMRVLQDNSTYCQKIILERLHCDAS